MTDLLTEVQTILGHNVEVISPSPLTFTCPEFGSPYNVAYALSTSNLKFGTLVLNERINVMVTPGDQQECLTLHKGRAHAGIVFRS